LGQEAADGGDVKRVLELHAFSYDLHAALQGGLAEEVDPAPTWVPGKTKASNSEVEGEDRKSPVVASPTRVQAAHVAVSSGLVEAKIPVMRSLQDIRGRSKKLCSGAVRVQWRRRSAS